MYYNSYNHTFFTWIYKINNRILQKFHLQMWPRQSEKHVVTKFTFLVNAWYLFASLYWLICSLNCWNQTIIIIMVRFQKFKLQINQYKEANKYQALTQNVNFVTTCFSDCLGHKYLLHKLKLFRCTPISASSQIQQHINGIIRKMRIH